MFQLKKEKHKTEQLSLRLLKKKTTTTVLVVNTTEFIYLIQTFSLFKSECLCWYVGDRTLTSATSIKANVRFCNQALSAASNMQ